ncbi:MAG TPA: XdhC family protein, partial [Pyrinomonadaceae bacterium]|nr:XdhC family protein [Pyrinomonadaceae bacterium]
MTERNNQTSSVTKMSEQILERGEIALVVTLLSGPGSIGAKMLVHEKGATTGSLGDLDSWVVEKATGFLASREETRMFTVGDTSLLFERLEPARRLVVCGAGHVGASLARLAAFTGYHTTLIDDRAEFLKR